MALWLYNQQTHRYRVGDEGAQVFGQRAGTFLSERRLTQVRDEWIAVSKQRVNAMAEQLASGRMTVQEWTYAMRREVRTNFINEYMLGHGGRSTMTPADWGRIGNKVQDQYRFLDNFAHRIEQGGLSEAQIAARARMYVEASSQAYEHGRAAGMGAPDLPAYPGDGSTECVSNCKCHWDIQQADTEWLCFWRLGAAEHCNDCVTRSETWNPLRFPKAQAATKSELDALLEDALHGYQA